MKKRKPKVIRYHPYFETITRDNLVFTRDRDIAIEEKELWKEFEQRLKAKGLKFIKKRIGNYYRYWIKF